MLAMCDVISVNMYIKTDGEGVGKFPTGFFQLRVN